MEGAIEEEEKPDARHGRAVPNARARWGRALMSSLEHEQSLASAYLLAIAEETMDAEDGMRGELLARIAYRWDDWPANDGRWWALCLAIGIADASPPPGPKGELREATLT